MVSAARRPRHPGAGSRVSPQQLASLAAAAGSLPMVKLEAAGNDFLVLLDPWPHEVALLTPVAVRAVCDRHRGVGADGLIVGRRVAPAAAKGAPGKDAPARADLEMSLFNADGSEAEMSGNGIRCLVHAAVLEGAVEAGDVHVTTAAGLRTVAYESGAEAGDGRVAGAGDGAGDGAGHGWARVDMGPVRLGDEVESPVPGTRARLADVGNPHLVAIGGAELELGSLNLGALEELATRAAGGAVNLEVVRRPGRAGADLDLRVLERGVGETLACGTGSCAAAAVARAFGMTGDTDRVTVDNPGGRLEVRFGPECECVELGGPVRKVADIALDVAFLRSRSSSSASPNDGDG